MDHFGIGNAMQQVARAFFQGCRQTGRTTSLVESLRDGDRVVCLNTQSARQLHELLRQRGLQVETEIIEPRFCGELLRRGTSTGRTLFDHTWLEAFYELQLERAAHEVDRLQREASGFGAAHFETRQAARQQRGFLKGAQLGSPWREGEDGAVRHVGMTVAGDGASQLGKLMREQHDTRKPVEPDKL
jgi:hypothetical protein